MSWKCEQVQFEELAPSTSDNDYALHIAALEWSLADPIVISSKEDIKSRANWRERLEPYNHQVENLITFCRRLPVTLLADDVGLGKTISAGLILAELMERKRVSRAFVVCPAILGKQWVEELDSKFGIPAIFVKGHQLEGYLGASSIPVIVTTYDSARTRLDGFRPEQFDMIILDEAHKLRNLHGTPKPPQMAQRIKDALQSRIFKYVLMLTATPIQNRVWDLYSLVDLLAVAKGHQNPLGTPEVFRARYIADTAGRRLKASTTEMFRSILRQYVVRTRREDARLKFPDRHVETRKLRSSDAERRMAQLVAEHIGNLSAFVQISISQAMMSSPQALATQLENMVEGKSPIPESVAVEARALADGNPRTAKLDGLLKLVRELRQNRPNDWRLVVFTMRRETQEAIGRAMTAEGINIGFIRGGSVLANQKTVERYWKNPPELNVIISTDAGAEGVNLQAGNVLVNYDLPWNPMVLEQRIGRIQRLASKHDNVAIVNLVIAGSVEERVVARLLEKLQVISQTIGDIETILESTGQDDEDSFEEMIRKLVVDSLKGQNVDYATELAEASLKEAKAKIDSERGTMDQVFGANSTDPGQGPQPPKLVPVPPSMRPDEFALAALSAEGATVRPRSDDTFDVVRRAQAPERITFKPEVAERDGTGVFMGNAPKLYLPGRPQFERLVQRWLNKSSHCLRDLCSDGETHSWLAAKSWCDSVPDATFDSVKVEHSKQHVTGQLVCRAKAANGVDSLEKLVRVTAFIDAHGEIDHTLKIESPVVRDSVKVDSLFAQIGNHVDSKIGRDSDIDAFCNFYEARRRDEIAKAGVDSVRRHRIESDFAPKIFAEVVGFKGAKYEVVNATVSFFLDSEHPYKLQIEMVPASRVVLNQPSRLKCCLTDRELPEPCIATCAISQKLATAHLLRTSISGRKALPEFAVTCQVSGQTALIDEVWKSDLTGKTALITSFRESPVSGRKGIIEEDFDTCEITGASVLRDELIVSEISDKRFRKDQGARSAISNRIGHLQEFIVCAVTGDLIAPDESGTSAASGKVVRADLLIPSEKEPHRSGLESETVQCSATGKRLLTDEVATSAVSGKVFDRELAVPSAKSGRAGLIDEMARCEITGQLLLPEETDISSLSGKRVRADLLTPSQMSGRKGLADEIAVCGISFDKVLKDELVESAESRVWFRKDQQIVSGESGRVAHESEAIKCSATGKLLLKSEAGQSSVSGKDYSKSLLSQSDKPPRRLGVESEFVRCELSGNRLLTDEVVRSAVSGKIVDRDLAVLSEKSGRPALPDETIRCEASGKRVLPDETACSAFSGKRALTELLTPSSIDGRLGLEDEFFACEITSTRVLSDELLESAETGRKFRKDEAVKSSESGRIAHRSETVECSATHQPILKSESAQSAITGKSYRKTLLMPSEKPPHRLGLEAELTTCSKSGKRLLTDEVGLSAVSGQQIDRDLLQPSYRSGKLALPEELVTCEESGKALLPEEIDICCITGKHVDKELLAKSELSTAIGLASKMEHCGVSGRLALPSELSVCEVTGMRVDPAELLTCSVTGKRAVQFQMIASDVSKVPMLPDYAVISPISKRACTPAEAVGCAWRGVRLLPDEVSTCRLTGLSFSREFINEAGEFSVLRNLLNAGTNGIDASDIVEWLSEQMPNPLPHLVSAKCVFSPDGSVRAVCGAIRSMLGLRVKYGGLIISQRSERRVIGRAVVGKRSQDTWVPAS
jgi:superfamily II DNA or RNA helicase